MTTKYKPDDKEPTARLRGTLQVSLIEKGNVYPVHVPVVDLPQYLLDEIPDGEEWRGIEVHIMDRAVVLCMN